MRVGWLVDAPEIVGGAELTQAEFRRAVPEGVEIVDCPPGGVQPGLDTYVIHNCVSYRLQDIERIGGASMVRYVHDVWPHGLPEVRRLICASGQLIFCSPLHRDRFPHPYTLEAALIPPPISTKRTNGVAREGTAWLGRMYRGKGIPEAVAWAEENGPVDFYGFGPTPPAESEVVRLCGKVDPGQVAQLLAGYERFLFLPTVVEPFARCVAEAYFAGCEVITNSLVGARYWLEEEPQALDTAAEDFWQVVLS